MRTLIDKINYFEDGTETVGSFNEIFTDTPLHAFYNSSIVTIGEPCSPETCRELTVDGGTSFRHDFKSPANKAEASYQDGDVKFHNEYIRPKVQRGSYSTKIVYNEENFVMTKQEMELKPTHYFLLQYLRGCESSFHTKEEIASNLGLNVRTLTNNLPEMEFLGIITIEKHNRSNQPKTKILINSDWA